MSAQRSKSKQSTEPHVMGNTIRFSVELAARTKTEGEVFYLRLPKSASAELRSAGTIMVEGTIEGFPFRAPLESDGKGGRALKVSKALQVAAGAKAGEMVVVELTRVGDEREVRVPSDLMTALETAGKAKALWTQITPMARREWVRWVSSAKQAETRDGRIEKGCDMMAKGKRRPCCFPGINWVTKDLVGQEETWVGLPGAKK